MTQTSPRKITNIAACMACNSTDFEHGPVVTSGSDLTRSVECSQCGSSWEEQLGLTVTGVTRVLDYAVGTVLYSLKPETDCDANDVECTTPAGFEWMVESLGVNGNGSANKVRSIVCADTGCWILPEVSELKRDFGFLGDHRFLYFVHDDMEIRNPTVSPCGRFSVDPAQYGFVRHSDDVMILVLPERAGKLLLTKIGDDFELLRQNAKGVVLAREMVSKIKFSCEEDEAVAVEIAPAPIATNQQVVIKCTDKLGNISYLKRRPAGHWFAVLASGIPAGVSYCGISGDEVGFLIELERTKTPDEALALVKSRGPANYFTYELV